MPEREKGIRKASSHDSGILREGRAAESLRKTAAGRRRGYPEEIIRCLPDAVVAVDLRGRIIEFNAAAERVFGYDLKEVAGRGASFLFAHSHEAEKIRKTWGGGSNFAGRIIFRRKDGSTFSSFFSLTLLIDASGSAVGSLGVARDAGCGECAETPLRSQRFLDTIFDSIKDPFSIVDRDYRIVRANAAYAEMRNRRCEELIGRRCFEVLHDRTTACDDCIVEKTFQSSDPCAKDKFLSLTDGDGIWLEIYTYPIVDDGGSVSHVIEYTRDITGRRKSEEEKKRLIERLERLSNTDVLTGLPNRRALLERLQYEAERAVRYDSELSLVLCDIDYFKEINDSHGHLSGDDALRVLAGTLRNSLRSTDILGRYGGDEFMLILPETPVNGAVEFAERLRISMKTAGFRIRGSGAITLSLSCGVTCLRYCRGASVDELITLADDALYLAKRTGKDRVCVAGPQEPTGRPPAR